LNNDAFVKHVSLIRCFLTIFPESFQAAFTDIWR